ncbi:transcriptional regulator, TetR family [Sphingomonas laterariae]|uniref:Transcriptional regulator, TetR family n=1 Tax=Edaphosphingomonas laterariae TaxID=861865 RepID=A0A239BG60_9SPHN|nr:TetR family transcriptional regulator C-terminal domain-containing protein [Sphingomonas laterariae]SNS06709.1 transcriptional regulator, TetR family [Sphingomonas laterariae]
MSRATFTREEADSRRQDLIDACARKLADGGVAAATVRAICAEAGVSPGLLRHYFAGIDDLVAATYRTVGERVKAALDAAVAQADHRPRARLSAYVVASFRAPIADPALLATWIAFWSLVKANAAIAHLHADIYGGYRAGIEALLAENGVAPGDCRLKAVAITALVDGLWLELCLAPDTFTPDEAAEMAERWLDALLG